MGTIAPSELIWFDTSRQRERNLAEANAAAPPIDFAAADSQSELVEDYSKEPAHGRDECCIYHLLVFIKGEMIEGPLSGKVESDSASAADLTALTATVAGNTSAITAKAPTSVVDALATEVATKASGSGLIAAEAAITTHTGQIVSLNTSVNNMGNSF